jgi:hypothetical protein
VLGALGARWNLAPGLSFALVVVLGVGLLGQAVPSAFSAQVRSRFSRLPLVAQGLLFACMILLIEVVGPQGVAPFIYFQF